MTLLGIIYNVLVHPSQEFKVTAIGPVPKDILTVYGAIVVFIVSGLGILYFPVTSSINSLFFQFLISGILGLICWFFMGMVFSTTAYVFNVRGRPQTLLILTAYSMLPWVFLPVIALFKWGLGILGYSVNILGLLGLWLWTTVLFLMALKYTYNMTWDRVLLAVGLPFIMAFLGVSWIGSFLFSIFLIISSNI